MATPLALSLDASARARERKRNNCSLLLAAILFSPSYLSFIIEINQKYVNDKLQRLLPQPSRAALEHQKPGSDRVLHGDASGDLNQRTGILQATFDKSETVTRGWGRDSPKRTNRVRRPDTAPPTRRRFANKLTTPKVLGRDGAGRGGLSDCVSCNTDSRSIQVVVT